MRVALAEAELQGVLVLQVVHKTSMGSGEFFKVMRDGQTRWADLIKRFNIKVE